jgi:hypothetical protein
MGNRANIIVRQEDGDIFLYSHYDGERLVKTLQTALTFGKNRWNDPSYLTRIIFSEMIRGAEHDELGYGISLSMVDNDGHDLLIVDTNTKKITIISEKDGLIKKSRKLKETFDKSISYSYSFEEYINLKNRNLPRI